ALNDDGYAVHEHADQDLDGCHSGASGSVTDVGLAGRGPCGEGSGTAGCEEVLPAASSFADVLSIVGRR
ncbi:MAG TPA: hypothetical protein QGF43_04980, partial [Acidimicrobiales bacterium]|nr:hypothetical protein [Acidimicrobiales bacterium]